MSSVLILITGGTIDELEYDSEDEAPIGRDSIIPGFLKEIFPDENFFSTQTLMQKDSQFISDEDRSTIWKAIESAPATKIVITHGTKTMPQTAKFLGPNIRGKTVVLTGCMVLPSLDEGKDARAHLKLAIEKAQSLPAGVYIVMQGKVFEWDNVRKNTAKGQFETER